MLVFCSTQIGWRRYQLVPDSGFFAKEILDYLEDNPEVFWIHFTGSDVKNILAYHGISLDEHVFYCGVLPDYKALFRKIIQELQLCRYGYEDYIASLFNDILLLVDRQQHEQKKATGNVQEQIERATAYFNENYNTKISMAAFLAASAATSASAWLVNGPSCPLSVLVLVLDTS